MSEPDLSEFEELSIGKKKGQCRVCAARDTLSKEEQAQLDAACAASSLTGGAIARWLERRGHELHSNSVTAHRSRCVNG